jgi:hypothetical protein
MSRSAVGAVPVATQSQHKWKGTLMQRQEIDEELSTAGAQELLASTSAAHLAYIGQDGTPRVIPVGFFWTGDQVNYDFGAGRIPRFLRELVERNQS